MSDIVYCASHVYGMIDIKFSLLFHDCVGEVPSSLILSVYYAMIMYVRLLHG